MTPKKNNDLNNSYSKKLRLGDLIMWVKFKDKEVIYLKVLEYAYYDSSA
jgi:hypothetical protein